MDPGGGGCVASPFLPIPLSQQHPAPSAYSRRAAHKMKSASVLALLLVGATFMAVNAEVVPLTNATYAVKLKEQADTLWFINFYAPWCPWSNRLAPAWEQLGRALEGVAGVEVGSVDCDMSRATCKTAKIEGYPTLKVFYNGEEVAPYYGSRDLESMMQFVLQQHAEQKASAKAADLPYGTAAAWLGAESEDSSAVGLKQDVKKVTLTDATYADKLKEHPDTLWFINFYAPWCPYSTRMAPAWTLLGSALEGEAGIEVASVDCTTSMESCTKANIHAYPSLKVFYNGEQVNEYHGDRDSESLRAFVLQEHAQQISVKAAKLEHEAVAAAASLRAKSEDSFAPLKKSLFGWIESIDSWINSALMPAL